MSDSVWPHRWKPTTLPCPQDSPGKNTGVGCHVLLQCVKMKSEREVAQLCPTLSDPMDCSLPGSAVHGIFQARVLEWGAIAFSSLMITEITLSAFCVPCMSDLMYPKPTSYFSLELLFSKSNPPSIELSFLWSSRLEYLLVFSVSLPLTSSYVIAVKICWCFPLELCLFPPLEPHHDRLNLWPYYCSPGHLKNLLFCL